MINDYIGTQEASEILGISERGVRSNCERGKYICRKSGSVWIIDKSSLGRKRYEAKFVGKLSELSTILKEKCEELDNERRY